MRIPRLPALRFLAAAVLAVLVVPFPGTAHAAPDVRIAEILAAPARDWDGNGTFSSRDDEWIEILNGGATVADLTPFFVTDGDSIPRYAFTGTLAPGAALLVTGTMSVDWERATGHPVFGLSLGNTGDKVLLWQITGPDTVLVDSYAYKSHESAADRSSGRTPDGNEWKLHDGLNPYAGTTQPVGTGCQPSPGVPNACGITPAYKSTWGRVKAIWR
jgi:hypothetical protein